MNQCGNCDIIYLHNRSVHVKKTKFEFTKFFSWFFLLQIWIFFRKPNSNLFFFRKKSKLEGEKKIQKEKNKTVTTVTAIKAARNCLSLEKTNTF